MLHRDAVRGYMQYVESEASIVEMITKWNEKRLLRYRRSRDLGITIRNGKYAMAGLQEYFTGL